jgi:hypothetical protein
MSNSEYSVLITKSDNLYVVRSTFPKSEVGDTGIGRVDFAGTQYDSFASKQAALDYADELVEVGHVASVEVRHIIRIVHKK